MSNVDLNDEIPVRWLRACARNACVEVAAIGSGFGIRDSKSPSGPVLMFDHEEFAAFLSAARQGQFDELLGG